MEKESFPGRKRGIVRILIKHNKQNEDTIQLRLDFSKKTPEVK